jgi:hypothetical protein
MKKCSLSLVIRENANQNCIEFLPHLSQNVCPQEIKWQVGMTAHTCDPSYSGGGGQEKGGLKPARANSS